MWSHRIIDTAHKIVELKYTTVSPYDSTLQSSYKMFYQSWAFGACSTATLWKWSGIGSRGCDEAVLAGFVKCLLGEVRPGISSWDPHRVFAQVPLAGEYIDAAGHTQYHEESPFFEFFLKTIYPGQEPAYVYENRSHKSTPQRLYDFDTDIALKWMENYYAEERKKDAAVAADLAGVGGSAGLFGADFIGTTVDYFGDAQRQAGIAGIQ